MTFDVTLSWAEIAGLAVLLGAAGYLVWRLSKRPQSRARNDEPD